MRVGAGIDITQVDTIAKYDINKVYDIDHPTYGAGKYLYGQADEALSAGEWVHYVSSDGGCTLMDSTEAADQPGRIGVAAADIASGSFGWIWHGEGTFEAIVVNAVAAATQLTTTATAGQAGTGGDAIAGVQNIDAGVTDTRVTVEATGLMYAGA